MRKREKENSVSEQLHRNVQRFRVRLVFKPHRLCLSLNSRRESNKDEEKNSFSKRWPRVTRRSRRGTRCTLSLSLSLSRSLYLELDSVRERERERERVPPASRARDSVPISKRIWRPLRDQSRSRWYGPTRREDALSWDRLRVVYHRVYFSIRRPMDHPSVLVHARSSGSCWSSLLLLFYSQASSSLLL